MVGGARIRVFLVWNACPAEVLFALHGAGCRFESWSMPIIGTGTATGPAGKVTSWDKAREPANPVTCKRWDCPRCVASRMLVPTFSDGTFGTRTGEAFGNSIVRHLLQETDSDIALYTTE